MATTSTSIPTITSTGTVSNNYITTGASTGTTQYYYVPTTYTVSTSDLLQMNLTQVSNIMNKKYDTKLSNDTINLKDNNEFKDVIEYKKEKVYGFQFYDGTKIKTIREEGDVFSLPYAFYLALAKKIYGKELTFEGVLAKAKELSYQKYYVKLVKKGLKLFEKKQEEEAKKKQEEEDKKEQHKRYIEKKKKRDKKLQERYDEEFINLIAKAIKKGKEED